MLDVLDGCCRSNYFVEKIDKIRDDLTSGEQPNLYADDVEFTGTCRVSPEEVRDVIKQSATKSCGLDPTPTWILKECTEELLPLITAIANKSLESYWVPVIAHARPLLKKPNLDKNTFKNYMPVSNLPYLSKILEILVNCRLVEHLNKITSMIIINRLTELFIQRRRP